MYKVCDFLEFTTFYLSYHLQAALGTIPMSQLSQTYQSILASSQSSPILFSQPSSASSSQPASQTSLDSSTSTNVATDTSITGSTPSLQSIIQPVSPVNKKTLAKAFKPPVTIKSFFKLAEKVKTEIEVESASENGEVVPNSSKVKMVNGDTDCVMVRDENSDTKRGNVKREMSYDDFVAGGCDTDRVKATDGDKNNELSSKEIRGDLSNCSDTKSASSRSALLSNTGKKRGLDTQSSASSQPRKKAKQTTLFSTLEKMAAKKTDNVKKSVTCPICQSVFDQGISNTDLNTHIDNCIIE